MAEQSAADALGDAALDETEAGLATPDTAEDDEVDGSQSASGDPAAEGGDEFEEGEEGDGSDGLPDSELHHEEGFEHAAGQEHDEQEPVSSRSDLDGSDALERFEEAVVDALDTNGSDEFFRALLGALGRAAATRAERDPRERGRSAENLQRQVSPLLRGYVRRNVSEAVAFDELAELFSERGLTEALPVIAGITARTLARPLLRQGQLGLRLPLARQLVQGAARAARLLARSRGREALAALPALAARLGRQMTRRRLDPRAASDALVRAARELSKRPALIRELTSGARVDARGSTNALPKAQTARSRRLRLEGPVEIIIYQR
jgi:hypothetical protein